MKRIARYVLMLAVVGVLGMSSTADAAFKLRIEHLGTNTGVVIEDGVAGNDTIGGAGVVSYAGALGGADLVFSSGTSQPPANVSPNVYAAIKSTLSINSAKAGDVFRFTLVRDGFAGGPNGLLQALGDISPSTAGAATINYNSWVDATNAVANVGADAGNSTTAVSLAGNPLGATPGTSQALFGPGGVNFPPDAVTTGSAGFLKTGDYSLAMQATITFTADGSISFDSRTVVVPVPAGIVMALTGLPVLGAGAWVRRRVVA